MVGLVDAASRFDAARATFAQYAEIRIRGAMLDYLRGLDWTPRSQRQRARDIAVAQRDLERSLGRSPDASEVAERLGLRVRDVVASKLVKSIVSVDAEIIDSIGGDGAMPGDPIERRELHEQLAHAFGELSARMQQLLSLYYVDELTLKEIGARFGITESRVCQLHGKALAKLRQAFLDDVEL
jgi:RNA polymerase sigma factor for flagellar operon FliA